jgi:photosystem II stability/assembly factor-like uncharacterized protein
MASSLPTLPAFVTNRRLIILGVVALALVFVGLAIFNSPPPAWESLSLDNAHPLAVLANPADATTMFAGTEDGQVLRSSDRGTNWIAQSGGLPAHTAVSALLGSTDGARLYAGTSAGVFRSADGGRTWQSVSAGLPQDDGVDALAFGTTDQQMVLAGTELSGVYLSQDGGATWTARGAGLPARADVYGLYVTPDARTWYAALIGAGVYASTDGGATWVARSAGLPPHANAFAITAVSDVKHQTYLVTATDHGVFRSTDAGQTWTAANTGLPTTRALSLVTDASVTGQLLTGTDEGVYVSNDAAATWRSANQGLPAHTRVGALAISQLSNQPTLLYAAADHLYRFPGQSANVGAALLRIVIILALVGGLFYIGMRQNRIVRAMLPAEPPPARPTAPQPGQPRVGATGHIRGGPAARTPPAPPPPGDDERQP